VEIVSPGICAQVLFNKRYHDQHAMLINVGIPFLAERVLDIFERIGMNKYDRQM
jgi:hypothetical protein